VDRQVWIGYIQEAKARYLARSKAWVCGRSLAGIVGSNSAGAWISVSCECCMLLGRGRCVGLITRPEESYRVWRVCDSEASIMRRPWPTRGCCARKKRPDIGLLRHRRRRRIDRFRLKMEELRPSETPVTINGHGVTSQKTWVLKCNVLCHRYIGLFFRTPQLLRHSLFRKYMGLKKFLETLL
jgi:hypothetical protein